jgi:hypothetical protein
VLSNNHQALLERLAPSCIENFYETFPLTVTGEPILNYREARYQSEFKSTGDMEQVPGTIIVVSCIHSRWFVMLTPLVSLLDAHYGRSTERQQEDVRRSPE